MQLQLQGMKISFPNKLLKAIVLQRVLSRLVFGCQLGGIIAVEQLSGIGTERLVLQSSLRYGTE